MSLVLPRSRATFMPGWVRNDLWRRARAVPSLDLRFADSKSLVDAVTGQSLVTFTRASSGTYVGSDGLLKTAANDVPRFTHDPVTGESLGLLVEEQRSNSIRNNTMVGAVAGTPGTLPTNWVQTSLASGLSSSITGVGTDSGISYIDVRINGTTADASGWALAFDASTAIPASSGQAWTGSAYARLIAGSFANIFFPSARVIERTAAGSYVTETNITIASTANGSTLPSCRFSLTRTSMGATTGFVQLGLLFNISIGVAVDFTLRIGLPQLEQGAFATSVIPTTTSAATRSADVASIGGSAFSGWYGQDEGSVYVDFSLPTTAGNTAIVSLSQAAAGTTNRHSIRQGNTIVTAAGSLVANFTNQTTTVNTRNKIGYGYKVNDFYQVLNGATFAADTSGALPSSIDLLEIGKVESASLYSNGPIRRLTYWPQRLSNTTLQALTQ